MLVHCPRCGKSVEVRHLGRKKLNIPLKNVYECLQMYRSVSAAANKLGCSQGYIFGVLKTNGLKLKEVINGKELTTKDNRLLHKQGVTDGRYE